MTKPLTLIHPRADAPAAAPTVAAHNLGKVFHVDGGYATVLESVDFTINAGELVCIAGPSGCGKTTLLKLIAGFTAPTSGRIAIEGRPIRNAGPDRCVVFQEDALFPWLTVAENIAFGAKTIMPRARLAEEVQRHLEMVGLGPFKDYLPKELSGGMKQRVSLARVLILKPKVLLMDEPFGALDAQTREEMQNLLLTLWQELSHTIIFVTHDLSEAITLADRVFIMDRNHGRIHTDIKVPLTRPRTKESDSYHQFFKTLRQLL
jgi:NitT/TauT family transport system ATP-binding protein